MDLLPYVYIAFMFINAVWGDRSFQFISTCSLYSKKEYEFFLSHFGARFYSALCTFAFFFQFNILKHIFKTLGILSTIWFSVLLRYNW